MLTMRVIVNSCDMKPFLPALGHLPWMA